MATIIPLSLQNGGHMIPFASPLSGRGGQLLHPFQAPLPMCGLFASQALKQLLKQNDFNHLNC